MGSVCAEHHHHHHGHMKYHSLISPKKSLQDLNIPPRKLLSRRSSDMADCLSSESLMQKYLPCNGDNSSNGSDDGFDPDSDPYSSDQFRMYEFKVRKCTRSRSHDWTDCPFSHPGEKARRRDPRRFHYSGTVCPEYRRSGGCSKGDECEFAHGVFECWLHPARYRTEACKDGKNCKRKVCFFAHSPRELRVLPVHEEGDEKDGEYGTHHAHHKQHFCCKYCCASNLSPTSIMGMSNFSPPMSPSLSPPMSPMKAVGARGLSGVLPVSRYSDRVAAAACAGADESIRFNSSKGMSYEDVLVAELLGSLEGMNINEAATAAMAASSVNKGRGLWVDVGEYDKGVNHDGYANNQMMQFSFSPSTPVNPSPAFSSSRSFFSSNNRDSPISVNGVISSNNNGAGRGGGVADESPDLGWVNDLLM